MTANLACNLLTHLPQEARSLTQSDVLLPYEVTLPTKDVSGV